MQCEVQSINSSRGTIDQLQQMNGTMEAVHQELIAQCKDAGRAREQCECLGDRLPYWMNYTMLLQVLDQGPETVAYYLGKMGEKEVDPQVSYDRIVNDSRVCGTHRES